MNDMDNQWENAEWKERLLADLRSEKPLKYTGRLETEEITKPDSYCPGCGRPVYTADDYCGICLKSHGKNKYEQKINNFKRTGVRDSSYIPEERPASGSRSKVSAAALIIWGIIIGFALYLIYYYIF